MDEDEGSVSACPYSLPPSCRLFVENALCCGEDGLFTNRPYVAVDVLCTVPVSMTTDCLAVSGPSNVTVTSNLVPNSQKSTSYRFVANWMEDASYTGRVELAVNRTACPLTVDPCEIDLADLSSAQTVNDALTEALTNYAEQEDGNEVESYATYASPSATTNGSSAPSTAPAASPSTSANGSSAAAPSPSSSSSSPSVESALAELLGSSSSSPVALSLSSLSALAASVAAQQRSDGDATAAETGAPPSPTLAGALAAAASGSSLSASSISASSTPSIFITGNGPPSSDTTDVTVTYNSTLGIRGISVIVLDQQDYFSLVPTNDSTTGAYALQGYDTLSWDVRYGTEGCAQLPTALVPSTFFQKGHFINYQVGIASTCAGDESTVTTAGVSA